MKKWIFSATVSLLLANPTLATNVTTSLKTEQVAAIEGYKSGLFLTLQQFKSDEDNSTWAELELKSDSVERDKATIKKRRTVHTFNLTQADTAQLINALGHQRNLDLERQ